MGGWGRGEDVPWQRWTPALPKPTPARVAARSIWLWASWSSGCLTERGRYLTVARRALSEKMSLIGFAPWYAGRKMGFVGRGVRSLKGMAVHDSSA